MIVLQPPLFRLPKKGSEMSLWLIGAGAMAQEYAKVLKVLGCKFEVIGRNELSAKKFEDQVGCHVHKGGVVSALATLPPPNFAIIAVGVEDLARVAFDLIKAGTSRILIEKPGGINTKELKMLQRAASSADVEVLIAYNRRFYASTSAARKIIHEDGGVISCNFEFTEWAHVIAPLMIDADIKGAWLLANSTHVIDLAFHLCGLPRDWQAWHGGGLEWHPSAARFCGAGITEKNIFFSYLADWEAPGRWGLEVLTRKRRLIFRPMEQLQVVELGSVKVEFIEINDQLDKEFKPGLYEQSKAFLDGNNNLFCTLDEQVQNCAIYDRIAGYDKSV